MQNVPTLFHDRAAGYVVPLTWGLRISFDKAWNPDITFAEYDVALYDDPEYLYSPSADNPIAFWDFYDYKSYTDRVIDMEWSREIDFPYSVSAAIADFTVNNYDDYFTPDSGSPIDSYILPKRPVRLLAGYTGAGNIQQFIGTTDSSPIRNEAAKTASFHALDFLSDIFQTEIGQVLAMQDVRTDEVLEAIFQVFGLDDDSYVLAKGRNVIPFLFFDKDKNTGNIIRDLMQAEGGNLWIDEQGIIRFEPRLMANQTPVMMFDDSNVVDIASTGDDGIINYISIISDVREVQEYQAVYSKTIEPGTEWMPSPDAFIIPANSSKPFSADLQDPCISADEPSLGEATRESWFTARTMLGAVVSSNITVTGSVLRQNQFTVFIENDNAFPVEIDQMEIWGEPAKVVNEIRYIAKDQDSIDKYELKKLEITNNFFATYENCSSFAYTTLDAYSENDPIIGMSVKGNFALQLGDLIDVDARSFDSTYKITGIRNNLGNYGCVIKAAKYNPKPWGIYDVSEYNGGDVYAP